MAVVMTREGLKKYLTVQSGVDTARGFFSEKIIYTDWNTDTTIEITITKLGYPVIAREHWQVYAVTPWVWRYAPLTGEFPRFVFFLPRDIKIAFIGRFQGSREFDVFSLSEAERQRYFSHFILDREPGSIFYRPSAPVVPRFDILRPQVPFTFGPEHRIYEQITESMLYFPRNVSGAPKSIPIRNHDPDKILQQARASRKTLKDRKHEEKIVGSEYTITSFGNGHVIRSVEGEYQLEIIPRETQSNNTPAYNFEFESKPISLNFANVVLEFDEVKLRVHHTDNVTVRKTVKSRPGLIVKVYLKKTSNPDDIGFLGEPLPPNGFEELDEESNLAKNLLLGLFTASLILIPGWGWAAALAIEIGELAYVYHTGRDFFGDKVSPGELAFMGAFSILGITGDALAGFRRLSRSIDFSRDFDDVLSSAFRSYSYEYQLAERGSVEAVDSVGENPIAKLLASLSDSQRKTGLQALASVASSDEFLTAFSKLLRNQLLLLETSDPEIFQKIVISMLEGLVTWDGKRFHHKFLQEQFERSLAHGKRTNTNIDPLTWLATHNSTKVVDPFLKNLMGDDYQNLIRAAIGIKKGVHNSPKIIMATPDNISQVVDFYDAMFELGFLPYKLLRVEWEQAKYAAIKPLIQDTFQLEHLLELRFARNLDGIRIFKGIDKKTGKPIWKPDPNPNFINVQKEFVAVIVPRTRRHASLLVGTSKVRKRIEETGLFYTQHPKTGNTDRIIPKGSEHLATPQEIADVISGELLRLNIDKLGDINIIMDRLENDFIILTRLINEARGTKYKVPVLTRRMEDINPNMSAGNPKWFTVSRNKKTDGFEVRNLQELTEPRALREAWAEDQRRSTTTSP
jgi:hypothetical protein